jgi:sec-independent protein translocase protein TatB
VFGLSFGEVLLLALVTLVVVGPRELPSMMRSLGRTLARVRRMTTQLREQSGIDEILRAEGIDRELQELRKLAQGRLLDVNLDDVLDENLPAPPRWREYPPGGVDTFGALPEDARPYFPVPEPVVAAPVAAAVGPTAGPANEATAGPANETTAGPEGGAAAGAGGAEAVGPANDMTTGLAGGAAAGHGHEAASVSPGSEAARAPDTIAPPTVVASASPAEDVEGTPATMASPQVAEATGSTSVPAAGGPTTTPRPAAPLREVALLDGVDAADAPPHAEGAAVAHERTGVASGATGDAGVAALASDGGALVGADPGSEESERATRGAAAAPGSHAAPASGGVDVGAAARAAPVGAASAADEGVASAEVGDGAATPGGAVGPSASPPPVGVGSALRTLPGLGSTPARGPQAALPSGDGALPEPDAAGRVARGAPRPAPEGPPAEGAAGAPDER